MWLMVFRKSFHAAAAACTSGRRQSLEASQPSPLACLAREPFFLCHRPSRPGLYDPPYHRLPSGGPWDLPGVCIHEGPGTRDGDVPQAGGAERLLSPPLRLATGRTSISALLLRFLGWWDRCKDTEDLTTDENAPAGLLNAQALG
jgi:hypothetical protein